jgi:hypothetical protein
VATDRERAMTEGSPALATLVLALAGALAGRALVGRVVLTRLIRRRRDQD